MSHTHTHKPSKAYKIVLIALVIITGAYSLFALNGQSEVNLENQKAITAEIQSIEDLGNDKQIITLKTQEGKEITIQEDRSLYVNKRTFEKGDKVIVQEDLNPDNSYNYYISDYQRTNTLTVLAILFIIIVLAITGWQGIGSIVGLLISGIILFKITLPLILSGTNPITAAILSAVLIIPATFFSSHGFNRKTIVAAFSTILTLIFAGVLAALFADIGNLTGLASEETSFLQIETASLINFKGLLLSGMIIGLLGILDDITVSQASIVKELKATNPKIGKKELYSRSMNIGRDHISSMVNTLILIYAGASLPLLLLFMDHSQPLNQIINMEPIAEEIIRTLVGSVALILAVPITTVLAIAVYKEK